MHLTPNEIDKLTLHQAGFLAQKRLARGLRLNYPEAVALIATQLLEFIRDGRSVAELMDLGRRFLGRGDVLDGVPEMIDEVQVEGTFPDGTKLVTVHHPIVTERGDMALALYGSFLPLPSRQLGDRTTELESAAGAVVVQPGHDRAQRGAGDGASDGDQSRRPADPSGQPLPLHRDQSRARVRSRRGLRHAPRHPGRHRRALRAGRDQDRRLVSIAGRRVIRGGNSLADGPVTEEGRERAQNAVRDRQFGQNG